MDGAVSEADGVALEAETLLLRSIDDRVQLRVMNMMETVYVTHLMLVTESL